MKLFHKTTIIFLLLSSHAISAQAAEREVSILNNQIYHGDDVTDVKDGETWTAIIESNSQYSAKHVNISVKTVRDNVVDAEGAPFTGKEISSVPNALFLLKGLPLKEGPLALPPLALNMDLMDALNNRKSFEETVIKDGDRLATIGDKEKTVSLIYKAGPVNTYPTFQLTADVAGEIRVLTKPTFDNYPYILWAGDLNHDGYPDFVLQLFQESAEGPALFLSKSDKSGVHYYKAADRVVSGC